ncbi:MAG: GGDEF domain-containing protein [Oscillospiraceae bacterium]|nr:GGDEF domain-containing protein [Oscillospiraceae bacterium]
MTDFNQNKKILKYLTLFFGGFLLATDVFFLIFGILYDMPLMRYVIYFKLVLNTSNMYFIINKHYLISNVIIYTVILGFMITGVICSGTGDCFQLYALGMLACISYNGYMHNRVLHKELPFALLIAIHVLCYTGVYIYAANSDPLYEIPEIAHRILIVFNSVATFAIVIIYVCLFHRMAIKSEEMLERMALVDNLTGLYNRHYLLSILDNSENEKTDNCWIAMLDIDNFKAVNDTYGHNCGDYILHEVAETARQTCKDCTVCRWGGEEFIILCEKQGCGTGQLETLRKKIADRTFSYENRTLSITVTIGVSGYDSNMNNDAWISKADEKLYFGKSNGKNQVVL